MIGNDIVDLMKVKKEINWQRKGFMNKIFSHQEQQFILSQKDQEIMVWILWSVKEAVYKINYRENGKREFAPTKILCSNIQTSEKRLTIEVSYHLSNYYAQTFLFENYIHSIATSSLSFIDKVITKVILDYPSDYPIYLQENDLLPKYCVILKTKTGIPYLFNNQNHKSLPISISHHGNLLGIAYINQLI